MLTCCAPLTKLSKEKNFKNIMQYATDFMNLKYTVRSLNKVYKVLQMTNLPSLLLMYNRRSQQQRELVIISRHLSLRSRHE